MRVLSIFLCCLQNNGSSSILYQHTSASVSGQVRYFFRKLTCRNGINESFNFNLLAGYSKLLVCFLHRFSKLWMTRADLAFVFLDSTLFEAVDQALLFDEVIRHALIQMNTLDWRPILSDRELMELGHA